MLLIALTVLAQPADACSIAPTSVLEVAPAEGATDVPLDARLRVRAGDEETAWEEPVLKLYQDRSEIKGTGAVNWEAWGWGGTQVSELSPDQALEPLTTYEVVLERATGEVISSTTFTTGEGYAGSTPAPQLVIDDVLNAPMPRNGQMNSCDWDHRNISLTLTPQVDSAEGGVIKLWLLGPDSDATLPNRPADRSYDVAAGTAMPITSAFDVSLPQDRQAEECFIAVHENAAGIASAPTELICSTPTGNARGCSTVGGNPGGFAIGMLGLLLGLRRRR